MKLWTRWMLTAFLAVGLVMVATGCGSDDDDDSSTSTAATGSTGSTGTGSGDAAAPADAADAADAAAPAAVEPVNVEGIWDGTRSSAGGSTSMQFSFQQVGSEIQGGYHDSNGYAGNGGGTINGEDMSLSFNMSAGEPGLTWTFSGSANAAGTSIIGTMTSPLSGNHNITASK